MPGCKTGATLAETFERTLRSFNLRPGVTHITTDGGSYMVAILWIRGLQIPHFQPDRHGLQCPAHLLDNAIRDMFSRMHCEGF